MSNRFEYQVGWSASSNASFRGESEWTGWPGDEETIEEVEAALTIGDGDGSIAFEEVCNYSGFEWYLQVREAQGDE